MTGSVLADATWSEVANRTGAVLVVPLGATEQHGPHLPLSTDTDTDICSALAHRVAARAAVDDLCAMLDTWSR